MSAHTVTIDSVNLATAVPGLMVVGTNPYQPASKKVNMFDIARTNKRVVTSEFFNAKRIVVIVEIGRNTRELMDDSMDTLNALLVGKNKTLLISQGSGQRQYTATVTNAIVRDPLGGHCTVDIEFECSDSFGQDQNNTQLITAAYSGRSFDMAFTMGGTAPWQQPIVTITLSGITGGDSKTMILANNATSQQVSLTRTFVNGDVIVFNSTTKKVTVNGTEVEYTGAIPEFAIGPGTLHYEDNMTAATVAVDAVYKKRYI